MVLEAAVASVATGVLKPVLEKLAALLTNEYKRFKGVRKEIKSVTHELAAMEAFLVRMSEDEDPNEQDKVWMNEVRELSYDLEDAIDDFMQSIGNKDEKPDGFIEKIKSSLGKLGKMKARRRIGREIQDLKKHIIEVGERNERYKSRETFSNTKNATVDPRALSIFEHASKLVGIDGPKAEIIKLLNEGASTDNQLKLISIVGTGGMGKTTLANQVYEDLNKKFKCRAFLSVARNPDMINIMRIIHSKVSGRRFSDTEAGSIQQVIININSFLASKRKNDDNPCGGEKEATSLTRAALAGGRANPSCRRPAALPQPCPPPCRHPRAPPGKARLASASAGPSSLLPWLPTARDGGPRRGSRRSCGTARRRPGRRTGGAVVRRSGGGCVVLVARACAWGG
ncbi:disease resistance protein RGA5-like [Triticum dicoccoides]|uniref:disease resistance protein RGA5-like n=1 Tax=Triticum dicoccoides TaxID=85692 RepID=UPI001891F0D9|nr:disease resistance protein RGA5-like [Triticum dicoccoides]